MNMTNTNTNLNVVSYKFLRFKDISKRRCWFCDILVFNSYVSICDICYNERIRFRKKIKSRMC